MCRSITTASGESSSASSIAARPSNAVPTTASSGWRSIRGESASRNGPSSSARRTRIMAAASGFPIERKLALSAVYLQPQRKVAVIGAPLDLNSPETSPSGNVHGMVLAAALGLAGERFQEDGWGLPALAAGRVALIGVRSLDDGEREVLKKLDARVFTMSDVDRLGVERAVREALAHVAGPGFVHVSLDMDAVDPDVAPGVGTPVRGGLSYREAHLALELVAESGLASSLDVVEVNPILDRENETGRLAVELAASALGARIL